MAATDHFATLGLPRSFRIDPELLERSYLVRSRELHPDHQDDVPPDRQRAVLEAAAALNNAYKVLRDPFRRAEHLAEILDPGVMEREKKLPPAFLMEAMELAERVVECPKERAGELASELRSRIADSLDRIGKALAADDARAAAQLLHRSRYARKALADLMDRTGPMHPMETR